MTDDQDATPNGWTRSSVTGVLSRSIGRWGDRTRVFQKRAGGPFYCSVYLTDGRRHVRSLSTTDHAETLRAVTTSQNPANSDENSSGVALGRLWDRYRRECETFRDTEQTHQADTASRAAILVAYFGAAYDVDRLNKDAQRRYERARAAGGLRYQHERRVVRSGHMRTETVLRVAQPTRTTSAA